ncbi:ciliary microtubule associated protein 1A-like [Babylonia areolata]|uniref:ciliary microtubule associated protein 1A-like n=1 Tax=Babylonia areolata TaxID=304850 RepID=UPI003FD0112D
MVYNYTIPRRPIAAMYTSPGPCYGLPTLVGQISYPHDPRSVHFKNPAYTFGLKAHLPTGECSPGPKYMPYQKVYRDGMDGTPHYSITFKRAPLKPFNPPGPGTYRPEKNFPCSTQPTAPIYSMADRTRLRALDKTPAPNSYTLPHMMGSTVQSNKKQLPIFTMRPKLKRGGFNEDLAKAPGPGTYNATDPSDYKRRMPMYSMGARVFPPGDPTIKPGPGAHRPEDCCVKTKAAEYSFGIRHSPYTAPVIMEPSWD